MTFLGFVNFAIFQWFFFRLGVTDSKEVRWAILFPVVPLTGWFNRPYYPGNYKIYWLN